jgi:hypothetical protein
MKNERQVETARNIEINTGCSGTTCKGDDPSRNPADCTLRAKCQVFQNRKNGEQ